MAKRVAEKSAHQTNVTFTAELGLPKRHIVSSLIIYFKYFISIYARSYTEGHRDTQALTHRLFFLPGSWFIITKLSLRKRGYRRSFILSSTNVVMEWCGDGNLQVSFKKKIQSNLPLSDFGKVSFLG